MIKLFRKIRQNLIKENRASKYLLYAIGEITLVVIGILIAIQLNNWKSESEENVMVLSYLEGLNFDLNQDNKRIKELYAFYKERTNNIQIMLSKNNQDLESSNDELGRMFNQIFDYRKYSNKKSTYLSLINDGYLNKIKDKSLINDIIIYYESPYLIWSTEIYENIIQSVDFNQFENFDSRDRLISINATNSIPEWKLTNNNQYYTDYQKLIHSKWARDIYSSCLIQANYIFKNIDNYEILNKNLRKVIEHYKTNANN